MVPYLSGRAAGRPRTAAFLRPNLSLSPGYCSLFSLSFLFKLECWKAKLVDEHILFCYVSDIPPAGMQTVEVAMQLKQEVMMLTQLNLTIFKCVSFLFSFLCNSILFASLVAERNRRLFSPLLLNLQSSSRSSLASPFTLDPGENDVFSVRAWYFLGYFALWV